MFQQGQTLFYYTIQRKETTGKYKLNRLKSKKDNTNLDKLDTNFQILISGHLDAWRDHYSVWILHFILSTCLFAPRIWVLSRDSKDFILNALPRKT